MERKYRLQIGDHSTDFPVPDDVMINLGTAYESELPLITVNGMDEYQVKTLEDTIVDFLTAHELLRRVVPRPYEKNGRYSAVIVCTAQATLSLLTSE